MKANPVVVSLILGLLLTAVSYFIYWKPVQYAHTVDYKCPAAGCPEYASAGTHGWPFAYFFNPNLETVLGGPVKSSLSIAAIGLDVLVFSAASWVVFTVIDRTKPKGLSKKNKK